VMREHLGGDAAEVMVQHMVPPGVDLRMHATTDARLGPVVTFGLGGAQADVIADEASRLAPVSLASAEAMLHSTKAATALGELEEEMVVDAIVRVAQLVSDHPEIVELDLNPVIVSEGACWVTDATVRVRRPERAEAALRRLE
jgi:acyl-CoA synthetase (NDP forming)